MMLHISPTLLNPVEEMDLSNYGPELIINNTFANGTNNWNPNLATLAIVNKKMVVTNTAGAGAAAQQNVNLINGATYEFSVNGLIASNGTFARAVVIDPGVQYMIQLALNIGPTNQVGTFVATRTGAFGVELNNADTTGWGNIGDTSTFSAVSLRQKFVPPPPELLPDPTLIKPSSWNQPFPSGQTLVINNGAIVRKNDASDGNWPFMRSATIFNPNAGEHYRLTWTGLSLLISAGMGVQFGGYDSGNVLNAANGYLDFTTTISGPTNFNLYSNYFGTFPCGFNLSTISLKRLS